MYTYYPAEVVFPLISNTLRRFKIQGRKWRTGASYRTLLSPFFLEHGVHFRIGTGILIAL